MLCDYTEFTALLTDLENAIRETTLEAQKESDETNADIQMIEVPQ